MKIGVTGANGQLGREMIRCGRLQGHHMLPWTRTQMDITREEQVRARLNDQAPELVVNTAAYTHVDRAESEPGLAFSVNRNGAQNLARCCSRSRIPLIHVSTDFVFDGNKQRPYLETDPPAPLNVYGHSKAAGETAIRKQLPAHVIVRTAWLYAAHGQNFVNTMLRLGRERKTLTVVADQHGCPTLATDLAEAILTMAARIATGIGDGWGTYHFCGRGGTTWHGFACTLFDQATTLGYAPGPVVTPITSAEYPTDALRPAYSVLDCGRIGRVFQIQPRPWQQSLQKMLTQALQA